MLILQQNNLEETAAPPVLNVKDSASFQDIPVLGVAGKSNSYIQGVTILYSPLEFKTVSQGTLVSVHGSKVIVSLRFSSPTSTVDIRLIREDVNGIKSVSPVRTISATPIQDGEHYIGEEAIFDVLGAEKVGIEIVSGEVAEKIYIAVV